MTDIGRAGRVRVERRLRVARHGAALLDRKQRIMADEIDRLQLHADGVRRQWEDRAREAARWARRAAALDGQRLLSEASPTDPATVEVQWGGSMGVTYPVDATCVLPAATLPQGSSALSLAATAARSALAVAVKYAAAQRAVGLLAAELTATRARQRAIENRWIPQLENELKAVLQKLEEQELEENLRVHWAADHTRTSIPSAQRMGYPEEAGS